MAKSRSNSTSNNPTSPAVDLTPLYALPTTTISDRLSAMFAQEEQPIYQTSDYLHQFKNNAYYSLLYSHHSSATRRLTPQARTKVVKWLYDIVDYFALQRETVAVAMSYADRFLSHNVSHPMAKKARRNVASFQLVALTCFYLAAKTYDCSYVGVERLARASRDCYTADEILEMEGVLLEALEWRMCGPTATSMGHYAIALLDKVLQDGCSSPGSSSRSRRSCEIMRSMEDFTRLQIELAVSDYSTSVLRSPSSIALGSILNSMDLLDFTSREIQSFRQLLREATGVRIQNSIEILEAKRELNEVFDRQSEDVLSRADVESPVTVKEVVEGNVATLSSMETSCSSFGTAYTSYSVLTSSLTSSTLLPTMATTTTSTTASTTAAKSTVNGTTWKTSSSSSSSRPKSRPSRRSSRLSAPSPTCVNGLPITSSSISSIRYCMPVGMSSGGGR